MNTPTTTRSLIASCMTGLLVTAVAVLALPAEAKAATFDYIDFGLGEQQTIVGANVMVSIDGYIHSIAAGCPSGGTNDWIYPAADIYLVKQGSGTGKLDNADGTSPATLVTLAGAFVEEPIAVTGPQGKLGEGVYDLVVDNCQDGYFQASQDTIFPGAVTVTYPAVLPPYKTWIGDMKAKAAAQAAILTLTPALLHAGDGSFSTSDAKTLLNGADDPSAPMQKVQKLIAFLATVKSWAKRPGIPGNDPITATLEAVENQAKNWAAIAEDPPDPDFEKSTTVEKITLSGERSSFDPQAALQDLENPFKTEAALAEAVLHALERYQGATKANNSEWTLAHARQLANLARTTADAAEQSVAGMEALAPALAQLDGYDTEADAWWDLASQVRNSAFTTEQRQALLNLGLDAKDLAEFSNQVANSYREFFPRTSNTVTRDAMATQWANVADQHRDAVASLRGLADRMDDVVAGLVAQNSVPTTAPTADAGGPYTVAAGANLTLDGTKSQPGDDGTITSYAWDTDGDGQFDDATGASPTVTLGANDPGLVGVKVTGGDGQTAIAYASVTITGTAPSAMTASPEDNTVTATVGENTVFSVTAGSGANVEWWLDEDKKDTGTTWTLTPVESQVGVHQLTAAATLPSGITQTHSWYVQVLDVDADGDGWTVTSDCNDTDPLVNPGRTEVVGNGIDDDCNPGTSDTPLDGLAGAVMSWGVWNDGADYYDLGRTIARDARNVAEAAKPGDIAGLNAVTQITAGDLMALAVNGDGSLWAWGQGKTGQLGTGNITNQDKPTAVTGLSGTGQLGAPGPKVAAISSNRQSVALLADGTVAAWGDNTNGALGTGNTAASNPIPALMQTGGANLTDATAVQAGHDLVAVISNGNLYVTGGVCGTSNGNQAHQVTGLPAAATQIAAGDGHLLIALTNGDLYGCGTNDHGQLGNAASTVGDPVKIDLDARPARIAAGNGTSLILDTNGTLWFLGNDETAAAKVALSEGPAVTSISAGSDRLAAVRADGTLFTWTPGKTPDKAEQLDSITVNQVALGDTGSVTYTVGSRSHATVAWGVGAGGPGLSSTAIEPPRVTNLPSFTDIMLTSGFGAGLDKDSRVWSWTAGLNLRPAPLGAGPAPADPNRTAPGPVLGVGGTPDTQLRAQRLIEGSTSHGTATYWGAILDNGQLALWGGPTLIGDGTESRSSDFPNLVLAPDGLSPLGNVADAALGYNRHVAITTDGKVYGWGYRSGAQALCLNPDDFSDELTLPVELTALNKPIKQVAIDPEAFAYLTRDGELLTCGSSLTASVGRDLPDRSNLDLRTPGTVDGMGPGQVQQVTGGSYGFIALKTDGTLWGWGRANNYCALSCPDGAGDQGNAVLRPRQIPLPDGPPVVSVYMNYTQAYAIRADGSVLGWGSNTSNGLGFPSETGMVYTPTVLPVDRPVWKISGAYYGFSWAMILALVGDPLEHLDEIRGIGIEASVADATVAEGGTAKVTVTLNSPAGVDLPITYATKDGSAEAGTEYETTSGTVTIPAGETSAVIEVPTIDNPVNEPDREFTVTLSDPPAWASIKTKIATVTIEDDDDPPVASISGPGQATEGNAGGTDATFTVELDHASSETTSVAWSTVDGTAHSPADYIAGSGTVTFPAGKTKATVEVIVSGDIELEPDEEFSVRLSDPDGLTIGDVDASATITDDEPVIVEASDQQISAPAAGSETMTFTISAPQVLAGESVKVPWSVSAPWQEGDPTPADVSGNGEVTLTSDEPVATVEVTVTAATRSAPQFFRLDTGTPTSSADRAVFASPGLGTITPALVDDLDVTIDGPTTVDQGSSLTVTATGSGGVAPLAYAWDSDGDGVFDDGTGQTFSVDTGPRGKQTITVQVSDADGQTATASHEITVKNVTPVLAPIADQNLLDGDPLSVAGSFTDPGTNTWTATVDYGDGPESLPLTGKTFTINKTDPVQGPVTVKICDDAAACDQVTFNVTITTTPPPLTAVITGPTTMDEGTTVTLSASDSTGPGPLGFAWDLDGDGDYDDATGETVKVNLDQPGTRAIGLRVTDSLDQAATAEQTVTITAVAPTVKPITDRTLKVGEKLTVTGSFTDPGANTWTATVDFGDGLLPLGLDGKVFAFTHAYDTAGIRTVAVQVCDDHQACGSTSFTVTVAQSADHPDETKDDGPGNTIPGIETLPMTGNPISLTTVVLGLLALIMGGVLVGRRRQHESTE